MRVSEYFKLGRTQPYLDFVDVRLDTDIEVFVDPSAIKSLQSPWGHELRSLLQDYFETVLKHIKNGSDSKAQQLLSSLNERNEFHLGYSKGKSRGHGFGKESAESVWRALSKSSAAKSGLLTDIEDTCLLIYGIGTDMISDAVCNILRAPLIKYTQQMCAYYGIPMEPDIDSGPIWNTQKEAWEHAYVQLPVTKYGKLVLVPKILVRHRLLYSFKDYYTHCLIPAMKTRELNANTALVETLRHGKRRVTKKALEEKYGADKLSAIKQTIRNPHALAEYKKKQNAPIPLSHDDIATIEKTESPDWKQLRKELKSLPVGKKDADRYENLIEKILTALFYPSLCNPAKQYPIHGGRKRIDITYTNEAKEGFFAWVAQHYPSALIFAECKNYDADVTNPELDQLAGRFSGGRGKVGILVCRNVQNKKLLMQRCIDTAKDDRGYIIPLEDEDIFELIEHVAEKSHPQNHPLLKQKFMKLIS